MPTSFSTNPPGAEVWATGYAPDDDDWLRLGATPFTTGLLPIGFYRVRILKTGFRTVLGTAEVRAGTSLQFDLDPEGTIPAEMVRVPVGTVSVPRAAEARLAPFLIDRYEVTNRQYKEFVDRGGYRAREYWTSDFVQDGRALPWEEAMRAFRDRTGRPGPSTWELGRYPPGQDDHPVSGVSWYEAAAYARVRRKGIADHLPLGTGREPGLVCRDPGAEQLRRRGPRARRLLHGHRGVRHAGHGRQREGVVLERGGRPALHPRRRLERAHVDVRRAGRPPSLGPLARRTASAACATTSSRDPRPGLPSWKRFIDPSARTPVSDEVFRLYRSFTRTTRRPSTRAWKASTRRPPTGDARRFPLLPATRASASSATSTSRSARTPPIRPSSTPIPAWRSGLRRPKRAERLFFDFVDQEREGVPAPGPEAATTSADSRLHRWARTHRATG